MATDLQSTTKTKKELVDRVADLTGNKRVVVKKIVQTFLDQIIKELGKGNRLEFRDFGVFETKQRAARMAQNPKTLERVRVPAKRSVKFKTGRLYAQIRLGKPKPLWINASGPVTWKAGEWHHVIIAWKGMDSPKTDATVAIYSDGKCIASRALRGAPLQGAAA